jgi:hypothetical protein
MLGIRRERAFNHRLSDLTRLRNQIKARSVAQVVQAPA